MAVNDWRRIAAAPRISWLWPGWSRLPRDARDTLFLLGVIGWTVLPHVWHLPFWCSLLTVLMLLWRAQLAISNAPLPGRWALVAVLLVAAGLTFWSFKTLLGKEPGVTLAVVLMALKTLELRARRDAFVVFFLGFFLILTHFLYSQSLPVAAAMLVSVWGLLTALVLAHMPVGQPSLRQAGRLAARTALLGAPIMALLFMLFPRIGPLWGVPQDGQARTGLSNSMRMGSVAEVAQDESVAMRLRFEGPRACRCLRRPGALLRSRAIRCSVWPICSGAPTSRCSSACDSAQMPSSISATARSSVNSLCRTTPTFRRATTPAPSSGQPRCEASRVMPRPSHA